MTYKVTLHRSALKFIAKTPNHIAQRITDAIDGLAENPRPNGCLKLKDYQPPAWRIRVGDYRVIYRIIDNELLVWVVEIDLRSDAYRN